MKVANDMENRVELLADGIMYVERGRQTEQTLRDAFERGSKLAAQLRKQGKPVLILNRARGEHVNERILELLLDFDFDRMAVYGSPKRTNNLRDLMISANGLDKKVASFSTEEEALAWLRAF